MSGDSMVRAVEQAGGVVDAISETMLGQMATAAQRVKMAGEVVRVTQQNEALLALMERLEGQKGEITAKLEKARGPMKVLLQAQLAALGEQQAKLLREAGLPEEEVVTVVGQGGGEQKVALPAGMTMALVPEGKQIYVRDGKKYERVG